MTVFFRYDIFWEHCFLVFMLMSSRTHAKPLFPFFSLMTLIIFNWEINSKHFHCKMKLKTFLNGWAWIHLLKTYLSPFLKPEKWQLNMTKHSACFLGLSSLGFRTLRQKSFRQKQGGGLFGKKIFRNVSGLKHLPKHFVWYVGHNRCMSARPHRSKD